MSQFDKAKETAERQEELLQFDQFNNETAWELGKLCVEEIKRRGIDMAVCIRKINGNIIFQYQTEGTTINNQCWMRRKFNSVIYYESSSLLATINANISGETLTDCGLSKSDYVLCGGGFPIRIKGSGIYMVLTVSNLPHEQDHAFIVDVLSKFLGVEAPQIEGEIPTV